MSHLSTIKSSRLVSLAGGAALIAALCVPAALAQDRGRDYHEHEYGREHVTRIERGTTIAVRTEEPIHADYAGDRVYRGVVDQDVRGENGRLAIPGGARVELRVRTAPDSDLVLDIQAINVNGDRFRPEADPQRIESEAPEGVVGAIAGAISGGRVRGRAVDVPRDTILNFRLEHSMVVEAAHRY